MVKVNGNYHENERPVNGEKNGSREVPKCPDCVWTSEQQDGGWLHTGKSSSGKTLITVFTNSENFNPNEKTNGYYEWAEDVSYYKYNSNGQVKEILHDGHYTEGIYSDGTVDEIETFEYYPNGKIKRKVDERNLEYQKYGMAITYDNEGNEILRENFNENGVYSKEEFVREGHTDTAKYYFKSEETGELYVDEMATREWDPQTHTEVGKYYSYNEQTKQLELEGSSTTKYVKNDDGQLVRKEYFIDDELRETSNFRHDENGKVVSILEADLWVPGQTTIIEKDSDYNDKSKIVIVEDGNKRVLTETVEKRGTEYLVNPADGIAYPTPRTEEIVTKQDITYVDENGQRLAKVELDPATGKPIKIIDYSNDPILGEDVTERGFNDIGKLFRFDKK